MSQIALAAWEPGSAAGFFVDAILKATVLLGLAVGAAVALRRASAAVRHCLWLSALGGLILLPVISSVVPPVEIPVLAAKSAEKIDNVAVSAKADAQSDSRQPVAVSSLPAASSSAPTLPLMGAEPSAATPAPPRSTGSLGASRREPMSAAIVPPADMEAAAARGTMSASRAVKVAWPGPAEWILIVWAIGFCGSLLPTVVGFVGNAVRRRRSPRVTDAAWLALLEEVRGKSAVRRTVELRQSGVVSIPITWGVARPVILLPADADLWPEPQRRAVLLHELAHVRRFDVGSQLVGRMAAALYWFHPLAWYALARLRVECEYAADDCLIQAGHRRSDYAEQLLAVARSARRMRTASVVAMARSNSLEERLRVLFDDDCSHRRLNRRAALGLLTALALVTATLASLRAGRAQATLPPVKGSPSSASPPKSSPPKSAPATLTDTVTGQVIGPDSGKNHGASVYLLRRRQGSITLPTHPRATKADAEGRFTFKKVPAGSYWLWAESGNRVSNLEELRGEQVEITANTAPAPFTLRLIEASRFRIRVTSKADGRPVEKAKIGFPWADIERKFETDANGIALVEGVRPREHVFHVVADSFAAQFLTVAATQPGTTNELAFALEPGGQIRGTVRDGKGQPMSYVGVGLELARDRASMWFNNARTDANGRYVLENVPLGEPLVISTRLQNQRKSENVLLGPVNLKSVTVDFTFDERPAYGSVIVHVTGPDHKPIAGAAISNPGSSSDVWRKGTTNAAGECRLDRVYDMSGRFQLFVRAKGFVAQQLNFTPGPAAKPARMDIELEAGHSIRGRVMLTDGKPAANVRVYYDHGEHGPWTTGGVTRTDEQGRFSLDSLPKNCSFTIYSPPGYAPFRDQRLSLDGPAEVTVTLDTAGVVKGRVVDAATGQPAVPYRIRLMASYNHRRDEPWALLTTTLGQEGRVILEAGGQFEFGDLPPGAPLHLMISAKGYVDQSLDRVIALPDNRFKPLEVRLKKIDPRDFRTVSGHLVTAAGKPVAGAEVRLWTTAAEPEDRVGVPFNWPMIQNGQLEQAAECQQYLAATTDKEGGFTFPNVRLAGYTELDFWGNQISPGRETVGIAEKSPPVVNLRVRVLATARLIVEVDRTAWPDAGEVRLYPDDRNVVDGQSKTVQGEQHRFTFNGLPGGSFRVALLDRGHDLGNSSIRFKTLTTQSVTLKQGETTTTRFGKVVGKR
jgi:beta-lactamase regulating signal transducer with metallopeptidase domain/5-hydroxyisourate hydrolase-like protein (transthyretin family)